MGYDGVIKNVINDLKTTGWHHIVGIAVGVPSGRSFADHLPVENNVCVENQCMVDDRRARAKTIWTLNKEGHLTIHKKGMYKILYNHLKNSKASSLNMASSISNLPFMDISTQFVAPQPNGLQSG